MGTFIRSHNFLNFEDLESKFLTRLILPSVLFENVKQFIDFDFVTIFFS